MSLIEVTFFVIVLLLFCEQQRKTWLKTQGIVESVHWSMRSCLKNAEITIRKNVNGVIAEEMIYGTEPGMSENEHIISEKRNKFVNTIHGHVNLKKWKTCAERSDQ